MKNPSLDQIMLVIAGILLWIFIIAILTHILTIPAMYR